MGNLGLTVNLLISALRYSTEFLIKIGVDPKPQWFSIESSPTLQGYTSFDESNFENILLDDLVVLYTSVYCCSLNEDHNWLGDAR